MTTVPRLALQGLTSDTGARLVRPHVRAGITFYPHSEGLGLEFRATDARVIDWTDRTEATLLSLTWQKALGQASGQWQAVVKLLPRGSLNLQGGDVMDGDWADLRILRNGIEFPICRGVVDSVRRHRASPQGATVETWQISGRDHGAPCEFSIIWNNLWTLTMREQFAGLLTEKVKGVTGGSPDFMFERLIDATFTPGLSVNQSGWRLPPGLQSKTGHKAFHDALRVIPRTTRGARYNELQLFTSAVSNNLWSVLSEWCNPLLNEWWFDLAPAAPEAWEAWAGGLSIKPWDLWAVIRERPFVNTIDGRDSPWFTLKRWDLPFWAVGDGLDVGRGGADRFNIFWLGSDAILANVQDQAAAYLPHWDQEIVSTHGIRAMQESSNCMADIMALETFSVAEVKRWLGLLVNWYAPNPYFLQGTVPFAFPLPEIRIGDRLRIQGHAASEDETYYVEGVGLEYRFTERGHHAGSTFTVTRGHVGSDNALLDLVSKVSARYKEAT